MTVDTPSDDALRFESFAIGDEFDVANADFPLEPPGGGDFHAAFPLEDGRVAVLMGDVVGHGPEAHAHADALCRALADCLIEGLPPAETLGFVNAAAEMSPTFDGFATVFAGTLEPGTGRLTYACGGHEPSLIANPVNRPAAGGERNHLEQTVGREGTDDGVRELESTGPPLGVMGADEVQFGQRTATVEGGGTLLLYTDGISEARRGRHGDYLGLQRLRAVLSQWRNLRPMALVRRIIGFARAFAGRGRSLHDDAALLALRRRRPSPKNLSIK